MRFVRSNDVFVVDKAIDATRGQLTKTLAALDKLVAQRGKVFVDIVYMWTLVISYHLQFTRQQIDRTIDDCRCGVVAAPRDECAAVKVNRRRRRRRSNESDRRCVL